MALPATPLSNYGSEDDDAEVNASAAHLSEVDGAEFHGSGLHPRASNSATEASQARRDARRRLAAGALKTAAELQLDYQNSERILSFGVPALDAALPQGGLLQGSVIELQVQGASGAATSLALCACRAAQHAGERWTQSAERHSLKRHSAKAESARPWCAFIDPSASLFAPGVARLGVDLSRLLIVRPEPEAIERVAIRIAEAKAVSLLVIDLLAFNLQDVNSQRVKAQGSLDSRGAPHTLALSSQRWQRTVRRLALAIEQLGTTVLLLTPSEPRQSLPLPVAMRIELSRSTAESFALRVGKERSGRVCSARSIPWSALEPVPALEESSPVAARAQRPRAPASVQATWH
jgi:recombination protein RecA